MKRQSLLLPRPVLKGLVLSFAAAMLIGLSGCASTEEDAPPPADTGSEFSDAGATTQPAAMDDTSDVSEWVGIEPVYFDFDKSEIRKDAVPTLRDAAGALKESGHKVVIAGHTDNRGTEEYNLALGERRAASVRRYLANLGVPMTQMTIVSYGEVRPAAQGNTEAAWQLNRRAEFELAQ
jgi:peptidoglycan-associated lipoprotein